MAAVITLDSPLTAVVGDKATKRKRMAEGLGLHTVGDLLRHFPRRYVKAGRADPGRPTCTRARCSRSSARSRAASCRPYRDRRTGRQAYRLETVLQTDGPRLKMTFFAKNQHTSQWQANRLAAGRRGVFVGQVSTLPRRLAADQPADDAVRAAVTANAEEGDEPGGVVDSFGDLYPIYPQTKGVESWDIQRAVNFARSVIDDVPELIPDDDPRRATTSSTPAPPSTSIHAPDTFAQVEVGRRRYRFEEALVTQVVLARRRAVPARARRAGPHRRRRAAGGVRRAAAVRADRRPARGRRGDRGRPRAAAPDEPAAPGRGRLRQDRGRAARDAAGRRLRRAGGAARADRGARPAALPLDHRPARRPGGRRHARRRRRRHHGRAADRLDAEGGARRRRCRGWPAARPAS